MTDPTTNHTEENAMSPHANHTTTAAGELLDADGSHCVTCTCAQCLETDD